jgi:hypothetical protein
MKDTIVKKQLITGVLRRILPLGLLLFLGCQNSLTPPQVAENAGPVIPEGKSLVQVNFSVPGGDINDGARSYMPAVSSFSSIKFRSQQFDTAQQQWGVWDEDGIWQEDGWEEVPSHADENKFDTDAAKYRNVFLDPGVYNLAADAYVDIGTPEDPDERLVATGQTAASFEIIAKNQNIKVGINLTFLNASNDKGVFEWDISFPHTKAKYAGLMFYKAPDYTSPVAVIIFRQTGTNTYSWLHGTYNGSAADWTDQIDGAYETAFRYTPTTALQDSAVIDDVITDEDRAAGFTTSRAAYKGYADLAPGDYYVSFCIAGDDPDARMFGSAGIVKIYPNLTTTARYPFTDAESFPSLYQASLYNLVSINGNTDYIEKERPVVFIYKGWESVEIGTPDSRLIYTTQLNAFGSVTGVSLQASPGDKILVGAVIPYVEDGVQLGTYSTLVRKTTIGENTAGYISVEADLQFSVAEASLKALYAGTDLHFNGMYLEVWEEEVVPDEEQGGQTVTILNKINVVQVENGDTVTGIETDAVDAKVNIVLPIQAGTEKQYHFKVVANLGQGFFSDNYSQELDAAVTPGGTIDLGTLVFGGASHSLSGGLGQNLTPLITGGAWNSLIPNNAENPVVLKVYANANLTGKVLGSVNLGSSGNWTGLTAAVPDNVAKLYFALEWKRDDTLTVLNDLNESETKTFTTTYRIPAGSFELPTDGFEHTFTLEADAIEAITSSGTDTIGSISVANTGGVFIFKPAGDTGNASYNIAVDPESSLDSQLAPDYKVYNSAGAVLVPTTGTNQYELTYGVTYLIFVRSMAQKAPDEKTGSYSINITKVPEEDGSVLIQITDPSMVQEVINNLFYSKYNYEEDGGNETPIGIQIWFDESYAMDYFDDWDYEIDGELMGEWEWIGDDPEPPPSDWGQYDPSLFKYNGYRDENGRATIQMSYNRYMTGTIHTILLKVLKNGNLYYRTWRVLIPQGAGIQE